MMNNNVLVSPPFVSVRPSCGHLLGRDVVIAWMIMLDLVDSQPNENVCGRHERDGAVNEPEVAVTLHQRNKSERIKEAVGHAANKITLKICAFFKIETRATLFGMVDDGACQEGNILKCCALVQKQKHDNCERCSEKITCSK